MSSTLVICAKNLLPLSALNPGFNVMDCVACSVAFPFGALITEGFPSLETNIFFASFESVASML